MNNDEIDNIYDDNEYDDNEYDNLRQIFINIGMEIEAMRDDPHAIMRQVLIDLISLHQCRKLNVQKHDQCDDDVDWNDLLSITSDEIDDPSFKYYISSDDDDDDE